MDNKPSIVRVGPNYYSTTEIKKVFKEWDSKLVFWAYGIEQPTKADKLLFDILKDYMYLKE